MEDRQLLRRFVEQNSQEAFAALTARYLNLVYSVCRRELSDAEAAEDVTQAVFLILARKAPHLRQGVILSGWLFQTARFAAKNARLQAQRRAAYEQKAAEEMGEQPETTDAAWAEIEPVLNRALAALGAGERECVLLRFFQGLSFAEAGAALGLSEEAARKRVTRALEKMRRFFRKEGLLVPGVGLAALLSAHAAKAAPATCQASITQTITGVLAGHINLSLTGSHVYQLSEGVLKAMKFAQIKIAVSFGAATLVGLTTYTVARGITPIFTKSHQVAPLAAAPKPGHVLVQSPGQTLTTEQIIAHCREAYGALQTYQVSSTVTAHDVALANGVISDSHTSANIQFSRPGKIRAEGIDMRGHSFAYVSNGAATAEQVNGSKNSWKTVQDAEMAIASVTGIAENAATTIPDLLLGASFGNLFTPGFDPDVREDDVDGQPCYVVSNSFTTSTIALTRTFWIDEKTFLLRRHVTDSLSAVTSFVIAGKKYHMPATNSHEDQLFTNELINAPLPDSTFAVPAVQ